MKPESASDSDSFKFIFGRSLLLAKQKNWFGSEKLVCLTLSKVYLPRTRICLNSLNTKYQRQD